MPASSWANSTEIAQLRDLAGRKGLEVPRSSLAKHYAVLDGSGQKLTNKDGSKAFSSKELRALLSRLPDRTA